MSDTGTIVKGLINITFIKRVRDPGFDHGIVSDNASCAQARHNTSYRDMLTVLFMYASLL